MFANGTMMVDTGKFIGLSPKNKNIVHQKPSFENTACGWIIQTIAFENFGELYSEVPAHLNVKDIYITYGFCGDNGTLRLPTPSSILRIIPKPQKHTAEEHHVSDLRCLRRFASGLELTKAQAVYYFLSGCIVKAAGTEQGASHKRLLGRIRLNPSCRCIPSLAKLPGDKRERHDVNAYLVNSSEVGGGCGVAIFMGIKATRVRINEILSGSINGVGFDQTHRYHLNIPKTLPGADTQLLNPRNAWTDKEGFNDNTNKLAGMYIQTFKKYVTDNDAFDYIQAGSANPSFEYYKGRPQRGAAFAFCIMKSLVSMSLVVGHKRGENHVEEIEDNERRHND